MIDIIIGVRENKGLTWIILTIGTKKHLSLYNVIYILMRIHRLQMRYNLC